MDRTSKKKNKNLTIVLKKEKCLFCGFRVKNSLKYGPMYKLGSFTAHYFCVLLSNRLIQNGRDNEGILGFLISDLKLEVCRTKSIMCFYCKKGHANIECAEKKCKRNFHLPCGLRYGTSHQFMDQFKSFCHAHRLIQNIPNKILKEAFKTNVVCCICYEKVLLKNRTKFLWAPCCLKTWYHRKCIQELANSAGYFFRCAACNDVKKFSDWMQRYGIFVPQQDASWELVPNAFEELLFRYNNCDAEECECPGGRKTNKENTIWEIIICESCGSQGIHVGCGNLRFVEPEWECPACNSITKNLKPSSDNSNCLKAEETLQKKRRRGLEDSENSVLDKRKRIKPNVEEEEVEVDVVTIDGDSNNDKAFAKVAEVEKDVRCAESMEVKKDQGTDSQEILTLLKPGPLSYKLRVIQKVSGTSTIPIERASSQTKVIELSDSDDDLEVIAEKKKQYEAEEESISTLHCSKEKEIRKERKVIEEVALEGVVKVLEDMDCLSLGGIVETTEKEIGNDSNREGRRRFSRRLNRLSVLE